MVRFIGEHTKSVDAKGRISIPAQFRKAISPEANETFVVSKGYEGCLAVRPLDEWNRFTDGLRTLSSDQRETRRYLRSVVAQASEGKLDGQGRIIIPKKLLDHAGVKSQAIVIGVLDKIEIWNPEQYEEYMTDADGALEEIGEDLSDRI